MKYMVLLNHSAFLPVPLTFGSFLQSCKLKCLLRTGLWVHYNGSNFFSGIDDNDTMKVFGKGGADVERNKPGDLYVTIKV